MKSKKLSPLAVYLVCAAAIVLLLAADQYTKSLAVQYLKLSLIHISEPTRPY